jgi:SMODS-associated and fused to various effectors sensor domain
MRPPPRLMSRGNFYMSSQRFALQGWGILQDRGGDAEPTPEWPAWSFTHENVGNVGDDMAVAVSLTHDTSANVRDHVQSTLPNVRLMLVASPTCGVSARSVVCGRHAFDLAEALVAQIRSTRETNSLRGRLHLFMAAPGGFSFCLGQRQVALGATTLYEFDFEGARGGSYEAALSLPIS